MRVTNATASPPLFEPRAQLICACGVSRSRTWGVAVLSGNRSLLEPRAQLTGVFKINAHLKKREPAFASVRGESVSLRSEYHAAPPPPKDTKLKLYSFSLGAGVCVYFDGEDPLSPAQHCAPGGGGGAWNLKRKRRRSVHRHERLLWLAVRVCAFLLTTPVTLSDCD